MFSPIACDGYYDFLKFERSLPYRDVVRTNCSPVFEYFWNYTINALPGFWNILKLSSFKFVPIFKI